MKQLILDVETQKTFDQVGGYHPEKLGISFVGIIEREGFPESGAVAETTHELFEADLDLLWPLLESADVIVGFNLIDFDLPTFKPYYHGNLSNLPALDLMVRIQERLGRRVSLDAVAQETLGTKKIGNGLNAITYYQQGEWEKLKKYCMKDVAITRDIYDHGRIHGAVKFKNHWNNLIELPVDFNFTPSHTAVQMTLV